VATHGQELSGAVQPFLAPLLGSLAGSLLPATLGTGIAASLGLGGTAAGGLIAAAAPKAIGAGIGTLLGGGDLGDAALNAVGFGAVLQQPPLQWQATQVWQQLRPQGLTFKKLCKA
jgi:hypothetical protein